MQNSNSIHYRDFLKALEAYDHENKDGKTFHLVYIACNRGKKTGGEIREVMAAKKCGLPFDCTDHEMIGIITDGGKKVAIHLHLAMKFNHMNIYK